MFSWQHVDNDSSMRNLGCFVTFGMCIVDAQMPNMTKKLVIAHLNPPILIDSMLLESRIQLRFSYMSMQI